MRNTPSPRFLAPLPADLEDAQDRALLVGGTALESREWDNAFQVFADLYAALLERQPTGERFHKGLPLHNMGLARLLSRRRADAFRYTLEAFAEDSLSAADEDLPIGEEFRRPAAGNLQSVFGVPRAQLEQIAAGLRGIGVEGAWPSPSDALAAVGVTAKSAEPPQPPRSRRRVVGQFGTTWDQRVFVGGSYRLFAVMNEIKKIVRELGFDGVMASDFVIPPEFNHHHALLLLHECRWAIFEVSVEAGQLMELERTRDYELDPRDILVLVQAAAGHRPPISGMVEALLGRLGISPIAYEDLGDLPEIIEPWLTARGAPAIGS
jgi:hypothetical protein